MAADLRFVEQHRSHWAQYPGHYEHQRFYDGFTIGWGDAMLFASWNARDTSQHAQELGFRGPWLKRRTHEHVTYRGTGNVWEFGESSITPPTHKPN